MIAALSAGLGYIAGMYRGMEGNFCFEGLFGSPIGWKMEVVRKGLIRPAVGLLAGLRW